MRIAERQKQEKHMQAIPRVSASCSGIPLTSAIVAPLVGKRNWRNNAMTTNRQIFMVSAVAFGAVLNYVFAVVHSFQVAVQFLFVMSPVIAPVALQGGIFMMRKAQHNFFL